MFEMEIVQKGDEWHKPVPNRFWRTKERGEPHNLGVHFHRPRDLLLYTASVVNVVDGRTPHHAHPFVHINLEAWYLFLDGLQDLSGSPPNKSSVVSLRRHFLQGCEFSIWATTRYIHRKYKTARLCNVPQIFVWGAYFSLHFATIRRPNRV